MGVIAVILRPGAADSFKAALTKDARLRVEAKSQEQFYAEQTEFVNQLRGLGIVLAAILGIGATFGGMNTMYAAVARRSKEIGVLRALGFTRGNILMSFVAESVVLGLIGGIAGELLGVGVATAAGLTGKLVNVGMYIFSFRLAPSAFITGLIAAAMIGALGGLLPAWRAARIGVIDSLREA
jgi:ABC-type antimicrobial peptide transport system permease subunit